MGYRVWERLLRLLLQPNLRIESIGTIASSHLWDSLLLRWPRRSGFSASESMRVRWHSQ